MVVGRITAKTGASILQRIIGTLVQIEIVRASSELRPRQRWGTKSNFSTVQCSREMLSAETHPS